MSEESLIPPGFVPRAHGVPVMETPYLPDGKVIFTGGSLLVASRVQKCFPVSKPSKLRRRRCSTRASKTADRKALRGWVRMPYEWLSVPFGVNGLVEELNRQLFAKLEVS